MGAIDEIESKIGAIDLDINNKYDAIKSLKREKSNFAQSLKYLKKTEKPEAK